ncbi:hypothetical protein EJ357_22585 [Streptomyces cyaneochromogenes]|uniref:Integrase n=1 Tax=Streptomyces cyaneochromogenes TaxID=2496836 RepID=A0A3Q9EP06_9ACTN|nr:hypothetical protein [Streptomyces cyaneochromogenes]AZQ35921.1 hypothetical protein EJ357_22585 [Streptomyces cyaneochromogenes]
MKKKWPVPRPTENAALRAIDRDNRHRRPRQLAPVPALMAALVDAVAQQDREGICLSSHRVVRAAAPEVAQ